MVVVEVAQEIGLAVGNVAIAKCVHREWCTCIGIKDKSYSITCAVAFSSFPFKIMQHCDWPFHLHWTINCQLDDSRTSLPVPADWCSLGPSFWLIGLLYLSKYINIWEPCISLANIPNQSQVVSFVASFLCNQATFIMCVTITAKCIF